MTMYSTHPIGGMGKGHFPAWQSSGTETFPKRMASNLSQKPTLRSIRVFGSDAARISESILSSPRQVSSRPGPYRGCSLARDSLQICWRYPERCHGASRQTDPSPTFFFMQKPLQIVHRQPTPAQRPHPLHLRSRKKGWSFRSRTISTRPFWSRRVQHRERLLPNKWRNRSTDLNEQATLFDVATSASEQEPHSEWASRRDLAPVRGPGCQREIQIFNDHTFSRDLPTRI